MEVAYPRSLGQRRSTRGVGRVPRRDRRPLDVPRDPDRAVQAQLGLRETTDTVHDPYAPAVFTLFPDLTIHRAYDGYWFWGRPTLEELRGDLRAITRSIRTDWEAPTP